MWRADCVLAVLPLLVSSVALAQGTLPIDTIRLPPGFTISVLARVPNARAMTLGSEGTLFVGSGSAGEVHAVTLPTAGKGEATVRRIASGLRDPAGVAFHNGALYVSRSTGFCDSMTSSGGSPIRPRRSWSPIAFQAKRITDGNSSGLALMASFTPTSACLATSASLIPVMA
jgi:hypothetical protein